MRNPPEQEAGFDFVAGASFPVRTLGKHSGFRSKPSKNATLEKEDFAFLDWLVKMAIETLMTLIPAVKPSYVLSMLTSIAMPQESCRLASAPQAPQAQPGSTSVSSPLVRVEAM